MKENPLFAERRDDIRYDMGSERENNGFIEQTGIVLCLFVCNLYRKNTCSVYTIQIVDKMLRDIQNEKQSELSCKEFDGIAACRGYLQLVLFVDRHCKLMKICEFTKIEAGNYAREQNTCFSHLKELILIANNHNE